MPVKYSNSRYCEALKTVVRDRNSQGPFLINALTALGNEAGRIICEDVLVNIDSVVTPMDLPTKGYYIPKHNSLVAATLDDFRCFAKGVSQALLDVKECAMDFARLRGQDSLSGPVRTADIPFVKGEEIDLLIVAKSVLATGCTAVSLTKEAYKVVTPKKLIITVAFYSEKGVNDLKVEFPNAIILLCGQEADNINDDGMLMPGLGLIEDRLR